MTFYNQFIKTAKKGYTLRGGPMAKWRFPLNKALYKKRLDSGPEKDKPRSVWSNWNYDSEIYAFGKRINEEFNNNLLRQAFIQPSFAISQKRKFEELGIEFDVTFNNSNMSKEGEKICKRYLEAIFNFWYPNMPKEGVDFVVKYLMDTERISNIAKNIGAADLVKSEEFPIDSKTLQLCFYAVIAALNSTSGILQAQFFVNDFVLTQLIGKDINEIWQIKNPRDILVEELNRKGIISKPNSRILWSTGVTNPTAVFIVGIFVDEQFLSKGSGETIEIAEEIAIRDFLKRIFGTGEDRAPLPYGERARKYNSLINDIYARLDS